MTEYSIGDYSELLSTNDNSAKQIYKGHDSTIEVFHLKRGAHIEVCDEVEAYSVAPSYNLTHYFIIKGSVEFWIGAEKHILNANQSMSIHCNENFSVWARTDCVILSTHNSLQPQPDQLPKVLVDAVKDVELRDEYLQGHNHRVGRYSTLLMQILCPEKSVPNYNLAGAFHDVGKSIVPPEILNKNGKLTDEEFEEIKKHPAQSYELLAPIIGEEFAQYARWHHEKLDGSGYPDHLQGEAIPLESRVMAVADIFDALTTARCYRNAMSFEKALSILDEDVACGKLDGNVVAVLKRLVEEGKIEEGVDNFRNRSY